MTIMQSSVFCRFSLWRFDFLDFLISSSSFACRVSLTFGWSESNAFSWLGSSASIRNGFRFTSSRECFELFKSPLLPTVLNSRLEVLRRSALLLRKGFDDVDVLEADDNDCGLDSSNFIRKWLGSGLLYDRERFDSRVSSSFRCRFEWLELPL